MCMYVYVCVCVCMYVYVCVCMCMYVCVCMCMYVYVCVCMCMYVYVCVCMCMYVYVCECMCMHVYVCVCMCMCISRSWVRSVAVVGHPLNTSAMRVAGVYGCAFGGVVPRPWAVATSTPPVARESCVMAAMRVVFVCVFPVARAPDPFINRCRAACLPVCVGVQHRQWPVNRGEACCFDSTVGGCVCALRGPWAWVLSVAGVVSPAQP